MSDYEFAPIIRTDDVDGSILDSDLPVLEGDKLQWKRKSAAALRKLARKILSARKLGEYFKK